LAKLAVAHPPRLFFVAQSYASKWSSSNSSKYPLNSARDLVDEIRGKISFARQSWRLVDGEVSKPSRP
jgi:hypothetical protein